MLWLIAAGWILAMWILWRFVKAGADEDARREAVRRHAESIWEVPSYPPPTSTAQPDWKKIR